MTTTRHPITVHDIFLRAVLISFLLIAGFFSNAQVQTQKAVYETVNPYISGYYESLPNDYATSGKKYPLLIFLHGLGEVGNGSSSEIKSVLRNGPPKVINDGKFPANFRVNNQDFSFIVISPQLNANIRNASVVSSLIDYVVSKYRVDTDRIYLTGLSMGGGISWIYAGDKAAYSNRLAGLAVVCGNTNAFTSMAKNIAGANLPVLITHNEGDPTVPVVYSKNWQTMLTGITPKMNPQSIFDLFEGVNSHDAWSKTYDLSYNINGRNLYEHLLQFSRNTSPSIPPLNQSPVVKTSAPVSITLPANLVSLTGQAADPDGTIASYQWIKKSGPDQFQIDQPLNASTKISNLQAGVYEFELKVVDNSGAAGSSVTTVTVLPEIIVVAPNLAPSVNAGPDRVITLPVNSVTLSAIAVDADGSIVTKSWKKLSGPSTGSIVHPMELITDVADLTEGVYTFEISVSDNKESKSTDLVTVTVKKAEIVAPREVSDCGCTSTLKAAADGGIYANGSTSKPGDKVCIATGTYKYINLSNFNGTASNPITIVNCGGQVVVNGPAYGFSVTASSFFRLTGTGTQGVDYGFKVDGVSQYTPSGLGLSRKSTDFEIDHLEFTKCDVGVICKTNPTCDSETWDAAFSMRNLSFHDLYLHDINGEGFYVGHTSHTVALTCNGQSITVKPQRILGLKIYNCRVDGTGWDGIQVANSPENAQIYNNTVNNFGTRNQAAQQAGILMGGLSNGNVYNNSISNGTGNGIQVLGVGLIKVYNNVVVNTGGNNVVSASKDGIFIDDRPAAGYPALYVSVCNNTVISPKRSAIRMENTNKTIVSMNEFRNNLMGASGEPSASFQGVVVRNNAANTTVGNVYLQSANDIKFAGANDYHLTASSPAVDAGVAVNTLGILTDKDGANRSQGLKSDAGAYEYSGTVTPPANIAPVANAGTDKSITLPANTVTVSGSGTDTDGSITAYSWKKLGGPTSFNIISSANASTDISSLSAGDYEFELTVTDNDGATAKDVLKVKVMTANVAGNNPPVANAGNDQTITLPANTVTLSGSGTDADGDIVSYSWKKISGPSSFDIDAPGNSNTVISSLVEGVYEFELAITDNNGATAKDILKITVLAAIIATNIPPVANAGTDQTITLPANTITLLGSGTDSDGSITAYSWKKVSGPANFNIVSPANVGTNISSLSAGDYEFELTVTDNQGATGKDIVKIAVLSPVAAINNPPVANAGNDQTITLPANTVTLSGSGTDADGNIINYSWKKISGPSSFDIVTAGKSNTAISSLIEGVYEFELTITDNNGATSQDAVKVTVLKALSQNKQPVANAGIDQTITLPVNTIKLSGTGTDTDGNKVVYFWKQISGPVCSIVSSSQPNTDVINLQNGVYEFEFSVSDDEGSTATDIVMIVVNNPLVIRRPELINLPPVILVSDTTLSYPTNAVDLSALKSFDPEKGELSFKWKQISGPDVLIMRSLPGRNDGIVALTDLKIGKYTIELSVSDLQGLTTKKMVIVEVANNFKFKEASIIYPNPVQNELNCIIFGRTGMASVTIIDITGRVFKSFDIQLKGGINKIAFPVSFLKPGVYMLNLRYSNGTKKSMKFLKHD
jgi:predicted esterase